MASPVTNMTKKETSSMIVMMRAYRVLANLISLRAKYISVTSLSKTSVGVENERHMNNKLQLRQGHREGCSLLAARDLNISFMEENNLFNNGKSKAGTS
ncbi:hypothetical protein D3C81_863560 [compost metagenome]